MKRQSCLLVILFFVPLAIQARVFNINDEPIATSIKGSWSPSSVKQTHFENTSGANMSIEDAVNFNLGAEIGLVFSSSRAAFRFGLESIHPNPIESKSGTDLAGQEMYAFSSDISVLLPKLDLDFVIKSSDTWRIFANIGGGIGTLSYKNAYVLTTTGQANFAGLADFSEEGTSTATMMEGGFNFEHLFTDTTTIVIELGYRQLRFDKLKYKKDVTSFTGAHLKSESVLNSDDTAKKVDFTGFVGGVCFRFYLGK